jgi:hypothetical protein
MYDDISWLSASDRLRILTEELRHLGPKRWILTALDFLADELEETEIAKKGTQTFTSLESLALAALWRHSACVISECQCSASHPRSSNPV